MRGFKLLLALALVLVTRRKYEHTCPISSTCILNIKRDAIKTGQFILAMCLK